MYICIDCIAFSSSVYRRIVNGMLLELALGFGDSL